MNCPVCKTIRLADAPLEENLQSLQCGGCGGRWIKAFQYWRWLETQPAHRPETPAAQGADLPVADSPPGKLCPECGHFLRRHEVGHGVAFAVDRCTSCGGIWLDRNEWEVLRSRNLHDEVHFIFSAAWQNQVRAEQHERDYQQQMRDKLGPDDYQRICQTRDWIASHPRRSMLLAFLTDALVGRRA